MDFEKIIGNEPAKAFLTKAINGSLANTYLFTGPDGIGKSLFAKALAKKILDSSDKRIEEGNHPDFYSLHPEGASELHLIETIRFLIEEVYKAPFEAKAKVFVIHEAEKMLPSSANALLKTLEEPTLDTYIILLCESEDQLLPTIVSRCVKISFAPLLEKEIIDYAINNWGKTQQEAVNASKLSEGSLGKAYLLCKDVNYQKKRELLLSLLSLQENELIIEKVEKIQSVIDQEKKEGVFSKKHLNFLLLEIMMWYRDLHLITKKGDRNFLFYSDHPYDKKTLPSLMKVNQSVGKIQDAIDRHMKFSTCLHALCLELQL